MTTHTASTFSVRPDRRLIRADRPQQALRPRPGSPPRARPTERAGRRSTSPSCSTARARCPARRSSSPSRPSRRPSRRSRPDDRFSVVVYDDVVDVVVESTHASAEARRGAVERLAPIDARGSTNLGEGWLRGCEQVAGHLSSAASTAACS